MIGLIYNCFIEFLLTKFGDECLQRILSESGLPSTATLVGTCPYADGLLDRQARAT